MIGPKIGDLLVLLKSYISLSLYIYIYIYIERERENVYIFFSFARYLNDRILKNDTA